MRRNYDAAFGAHATFEDFDHVEVRRVGMLQVVDGAIVACDPNCDPDSEPFALSVAPGRYPVDVLLVDGRIALARLQLRAAPATDWEAALVAGQDPGFLGEDEFFGYRVDCGVGCFMDTSAQAALLRMTDAWEDAGDDAGYFESVIAPALCEAGGEDGSGWLDHLPDAGLPHNVIIFEPGWGEGLYPSFWGMDAAREPVALVTDFGLVD